MRRAADHIAITATTRFRGGAGTMVEQNTADAHARYTGDEDGADDGWNESVAKGISRGAGRAMVKTGLD